MLTFVQDRFGHFHWDSVPVVKPITGTGMLMGPYGVLQSFDLLDQALRPDVDSSSPSNRLAQPEGANHWENCNHSTCTHHMSLPAVIYFNLKPQVAKGIQTEVGQNTSLIRR